MITRSLLLGAAASLTLAVPADAAATHNGWYAGLEGGASWVQGVDDLERLSPGPTSFNNHITFNTGWALLATVGFEWDQWRFEGEVGYRQNDMKSIASTLGSVSSNLDNFDQLTLMANMLYDIPLGDRFSASIGAGVGVDRMSFDWPGFGGGFKDDDWKLAWQGIAGLNYAISPECDLFVDYRYLDASGPDFKQLTLGGTTYVLHFDDVVTHTASAGLRYHF